MSLATRLADFGLALLLVGVAAVVTLAYAIRVARHGRARYARVDRQDRSPLLGRWGMEAGYWALQPVARAFVACRVSPNAASWGSLVAGILAGVAVGAGTFGWAAATAAVSAVLDALDGMVARHTGVASAAGEVLDAAVDRYVEFALLAGFAVLYRGDPFTLALGLLALLGSFMVSYSTAKAEALAVSLPPGWMRRPVRALCLIAGATASALIGHSGWPGAASYPPGAPMIVAVGLVAAVANASAAHRLWMTSRALRRDEARVAPVPEPGELTVLRNGAPARRRRRVG